MIGSDQDGDDDEDHGDNEDDDDDEDDDHEEFNFSINSTSSLAGWKSFSLPKIHIFNNFSLCFSSYVPQLFKYLEIQQQIKTYNSKNINVFTNIFFQFTI